MRIASLYFYIDLLHNSDKFIMKNIGISILVLVFMLATQQVEAQTLSKSERKALKKEIKSYKKDPEKWVRMQNRHKKEVIELSQEITYMDGKLVSITAERGELIEKLAALEAQYIALKKSIPSTTLPEGTVYQVQMGFYEYLDLSSFNERLKLVKAENIDGAKRYVIGHFENVMDALQFTNDMKILGVKDAFVSQYIDGVRNVEFEALQSISE